jgi:hypothetical protein
MCHRPPTARQAAWHTVANEGNNPMNDSNADNLKLDLECLRLASDCIQLADNVLSPELQKQLTSMARQWTARAEGLTPINPNLH